MTMLPGCSDAATLAQIIDLTGQIDDLIDVDGLEQDLRDIANQVPLPTFIAPRFAESVEVFRSELADPKRAKLTNVETRRLMEESAAIRQQASQFLAAASAKCLIAVSTRLVKPG